LTFPSVTGN